MVILLLCKLYMEGLSGRMGVEAMRILKVIFRLMLASFSPLAAGAAASVHAQSVGESINKAYAKSTVFLVVKGKTASESVDCKSGTGFLISSDGYALTSWHLLTDKSGTQFEDLSIRGSVGYPYDCKDPVGDIQSFDLVSADRDQDTVLLKVTRDKGPYDFVSVCRDTSIGTGAKLWALGFALGQNLQPRELTLGTRFGPRGFWELGEAIDPGYSGSPVFNQTGRLVAIVFGDLAEAKAKGYAIPIQHVSSLFAAANARTDYCRTTSGIEAPMNCKAEFVDYPVKLDKDDHNAVGADAKTFPFSFAAKDGYRIKTYQWYPLSSNNASEVTYYLTDDRQRLVGSTRLTSGPFFDRWRGWVEGRFSTVQLPSDCF